MTPLCSSASVLLHFGTVLGPGPLVLESQVSLLYQPLTMKKFGRLVELLMARNNRWER